jgi:hypothetical protein
VDRLRTEDRTWWCVPKAATPGDLIAIYVARNHLRDLPEDQGGIVSIFEIVGAAPKQELACRRFGGGATGHVLAPVAVAVKERFSISLKLADMKRDKRLSVSQFVRRSFQGTCFTASPIEFRRIMALLSSKQRATPPES